jgi:hypothetical protein
MADKILISIVEKEQGLEIMLGDGCYDNLALIGLLEKIKLNLLSQLPEQDGPLEEKKSKKITNKNYDA